MVWAQSIGVLKDSANPEAALEFVKYIVTSNTGDNKYIFYDNLTWQKGKHLMKMGGQLMRYQQNRYYSGNNGIIVTLFDNFI